MTSPMSMCLVLGRDWHDALMMCINGVNFYWADVTFHMSIIMFLLHDAHQEERKQQDLLFLWLLLGDFGLSILHGGDGGWQQRALLWWLLLGEYGLKKISTHITHLLLILHNFGKMLGSNKANRDKDEIISMLNQIHKAWDEEMYYEMEIFLCGKSHFI